MQDQKQKLHFYKIIFAYDGSRFGGSAKQPDQSGVQNMLDDALARLGARGILSAQNAISQFASRTDKNVHALTNVAKAAFLYELNTAYAINKINAECPGIFVRSICKCPEDFQPRFDAKERSYRYVFKLNQRFDDLIRGVDFCQNLAKLTSVSRFCSSGCAHERKGQYVNYSKSHAFLSSYYSHLPADFDLYRFVNGARLLIGEHDFCALCLNASEHGSTVRTINRVRVFLHGDFLVFNIFSSGFLRGQIRLIIGALLALASGKISLDDWQNQLNGKSIHRQSAQANGLYLKSIKY